MRIIALCGSLRLCPSNRALLLAAQKLAPEGMDIAIFVVSCTAMIGKPVALIYGSAGDANHAQEQLLEILTTMCAVLVRDAIVAVQGARSKVDDTGTVSDSQLVM